MPYSTIGVPDEPTHYRTKELDMPKACNKKCTLYNYPKQCAKSACPHKKERTK